MKGLLCLMPADIKRLLIIFGLHLIIIPNFESASFVQAANFNVPISFRPADFVTFTTNFVHLINNFILKLRHVLKSYITFLIHYFHWRLTLKSVFLLAPLYRNSLFSQKMFLHFFNWNFVGILANWLRFTSYKADRLIRVKNVWY